MSETSHRRARKFGFTAAPGLGWATLWLRAALFVGALVMLAFAAAPGARAATGGAASATPVLAEAEETTTTGVAGTAGLSFTPFRLAGASWYGGKSMWGRSTACGQVLQPTTLGVANKTLPCGTPVKFEWHGHSIVAPVIDRGPYVKGRAWDLTAAAAEALEFKGVGRIRYAVALG